MCPDWAKFRHLGYFLPDQFPPKEEVSTHGLFLLFKGFKSNLIWMFWAFYLSFDVEALGF